jgi:large subunit ribosomal protein L6
MSRVGKKVIQIPNGTTVALNNGSLSVKGPKGELVRDFRTSIISIDIKENEISFSLKENTNFAKALWGTTASHVENMVAGVNTGYDKKLSIEGVGYKWEVAGTNVKMALGFSHEVLIAIPAGLTVTAEKGNLTISGIDKELVGQFSAKIRDQKKPEPYKGKGIRYDGEYIRRKQGKKSA